MKKKLSMSLAILAGLSLFTFGVALATANSTFITISLICWIIVMLLAFMLKKYLKQ
ncbi:MAG: hypothetical protein K0R18_2148 [Bacillales bacterium]|jgi:hypothetical protein|nr:hypothetical protein [Bacillales bacterium]